MDDYYRKTVPLNHPRLNTIFEVHGIVEYHDSIEEQTEWIVNVVDMLKGDFEITIDHAPKDSSWTPIGKTAANKIINIKDCTRFMIESTTLFRGGRWLPKPEGSKVEATAKDFMYVMNNFRRETI